MTLSTVRTHLLAALVALIVAVFVIAPGVDAAECGSEPTFGSAQIEAVHTPDDGHGHGEDGGLPHGACAHGHCHHASGALPGVQSTPSPLNTAALAARPRDDLHASRAVEGLLRPPRS